MEAATVAPSARHALRPAEKAAPLADAAVAKRRPGPRALARPPPAAS